MLTYHDIDLVHSALANSRCDQLRHLAIAQVHVGVKRRRYFNLCELGEFHSDVDRVVRSRDVVLFGDF